MASWARVHSAWMSAGRVHFWWISLPRTFSQSRAESRFRGDSCAFSFLKRRYYSSDPINRFVFEDISDDYTAVERQSTAPHIPKSSAQSLVGLVREGKYEVAERVRDELLEVGAEVYQDYIYEEAAKAVFRWPNPQNHATSFTNWFLLLPDAPNSRPRTFHEIRDFLFSSPSTNMPLIIQFGLAAASKGYASVVEEYVVPIVARFADPAESAQFLRDFDKEVAQFQKKVMPNPHAVSDSASGRVLGTHEPVGEDVPREVLDQYSELPSSADSRDNAGPSSRTDSSVPAIFDVSDDYAAVATEIVSESPSVVAVRPTVQSDMSLLDTSVFEDLTDDYVEVSRESAVPPVPLFPINSTQTLARLVNQGNYEEAERLRTELVEMGMPIPPSRIYEKAAQLVLQRSNVPSRLEGFTNWFSLIPEAHDSKPRTFNETRRLIFLAPVTDMMLVIRFAIICASKGYAEVVQSQVIPLVMRFTEPGVSVQFLKDFDRANEQYWMKFRPEDAVFMMRRFYGMTRGLAVRSLAAAGRLDEAVRLLPGPQTNFLLSPYTYDLVLKKLRQKFPQEARDVYHIQFVQHLRSHHHKSTEADSDTINDLDQDAEMAASLHTCPPKPTGTNLALTLRYLNKAILSYELPHPFTFVDFMQSYVTTGRSKAIVLLRSKALRHNHRSTAVFIFAEMLYYRRQGLHDLVILTFVDHFYLTGVPRDDLIQRMQHWENSQDEGFAVVPRPRNRTLSSRGKVWPSPVHCALVWQSLVALTVGDQALERLYQKLLQYAAGELTEQHNRLDSDSSHYSNVSPLLPPPSWKHRVDRAAFTPFIRRLMFAFGPNRGALTISDMLQAGIEPSVYHFTELAGHYARRGEPSKAFMILDRMEANSTNSTPHRHGQNVSTFSRGMDEPFSAHGGQRQVGADGNTGEQTSMKGEKHSIHFRQDELPLDETFADQTLPTLTFYPLSLAHSTSSSTPSPPNMNAREGLQGRPAINQSDLEDDMAAEPENASPSSTLTPHLVHDQSRFPSVVHEEGEGLQSTRDYADERNSGIMFSTTDAYSDGGRDQLQSEKPSRPVLGLTFPSPDKVLYISLMRGFLISRSLEGVEEAERRMRKYYKYIPGEDEHLDAVYADLWKLQHEFGKAVGKQEV